MNLSFQVVASAVSKKEIAEISKWKPEDYCWACTGKLSY